MNEKLIGLWVDDERPLPVDDINWDLATTYDDAIKKLCTKQYDVVSLDHDLGCFNASGREMTGYDVVLFIVDCKMSDQYYPMYITCHSANPAGKERILGVIERYLNE